MKRIDMVKKIASYLVQRDDQICLTKEMAVPLAHRALLCTEKEFDFEWDKICNKITVVEADGLIERCNCQGECPDD